jgi:hypothetical protein
MGSTEELLGRKSSGSGLKYRDQRPWEYVALTTRYPLTAKSWHYFATTWRSLGRHSSLAEQSHGV